MKKSLSESISALGVDLYSSPLYFLNVNSSELFLQYSTDTLKPVDSRR